MADPQDSTNTGDGDPPTPQGFTDAQLAQIGQVANSAATAHQKRQSAALEEQNAALNKKLEEMTATMAGLAKAKEPDPDPGDNGRVTTKALQEQVMKLAEQLESSQKATAEERRQRVETEQLRKHDSAMAAFKSGVEAKLNPDLVDIAVGHFGKRITLADDGSPLFMVRHAEYPGAPETDQNLPLDDALKVFLVGKEVHPFLPPPGGPGESTSGRTPTPRSRPSAGSAGVSNSDADKQAATLAAFEEKGLDPGVLG